LIRWRSLPDSNRCTSLERGISTKGSAYSFHHARISELIRLCGVDPLTAAAQTETSLAMIEKAYLRFIPSAMQQKLAALKG
jgi:hypothetical protein